MCRNHSHVTVETVNLVDTGLGLCLRFQVEQPLTVDTISGGKLHLNALTCLYVPLWSVAALSVSARGLTVRSALSMLGVLAVSGVEARDLQEP